MDGAQFGDAVWGAFECPLPARIWSMRLCALLRPPATPSSFPLTAVVTCGYDARVYQAYNRNRGGRADKKAQKFELTEEQKQEIREAFDLFDTDGSGALVCHVLCYYCVHAVGSAASLCAVTWLHLACNGCSYLILSWWIST